MRPYSEIKLENSSIAEVKKLDPNRLEGNLTTLKSPSTWDARTRRWGRRTRVRRGGTRGRGRDAARSEERRVGKECVP